MQWSQIDWKKGRWVIPGKVMKNTLEADIPLTDTVIARLRDIQKAEWDDKYVFPGLKAGTTCSNNTMLKLLKADMERNATVHGFRSTFRTWGENETSRAGSLGILHAPYRGRRGRACLCPGRLLGEA
jgi:integrase